MKKTAIRIITLILVAIMVLGTLSGVLVMFAGAAGTIKVNKMTIMQNGRPLNTLRNITGSFDIVMTCTATGFATTTQKPSITITEYENIANVTSATNEVTTDIAGQYSTFTVTFKGLKVTDNYATTTMRFKADFNGETAEIPLYTLYQEPISYDSEIKIMTADTTVSKTLYSGRVATGVNITFYFLADGALEGEYAYDQFSLPADSSFSWGEKSKLTITSSGDRYKAVLRNVTYNGGAEKMLRLYVDTYDGEFQVPISSKYFSDSTSGEDEDKAPTPDIVVESVSVRSGDGAHLATVTKDTPPFTVEVVYYDMGLVDVPAAQFKDSNLHAFVTAAPGFKTLSGTAGTLTLISNKEQYPKFRAVFRNIQSDATANSLGFRVQYDLSGYSDTTGVKGESAAILYQIQAKEEEEDDELAPLKPNVIVREYSFGSQPIVAGDEFDLDITFANTSADVQVQNVVMTIEPASGFVIAAASNTVYFPSMAGGASIPYAVGLRAMASGNDPEGKATDYSVIVKFSYQYLSKKEYAAGETSVKIAIPVVQLDRFNVDEITDYSQTLAVGEEGYLTVPITNKGKSLTYNITGTIRAAGGAQTADFIAPAVHFGNLEAGKSGVVDMSITINAPGEFMGEAVVQYEDENMQQKEIIAPFSIMVYEQEQPETPPPPDMDPNAGMQAGPSPLSIAACIVGGLMMAAPIALYTIKRVKTKGNGDIDEDF